MATYTKKLLSVSDSGKQILVVPTTRASAMLIHTAVTGVASLDEVWIYAFNYSAQPVNLVLLWGGTVEPDNQILTPIPSQAGRVLCVDGMLLHNSKSINAYASLVSVILIDGFVNNIAP